VKVIAFLGLPGSGKTTARQILEERSGFEGLQMKDIAAEEFLDVKQNGVEALSDNFKERVKNPQSYVPEGALGEQIGDWVDSILDVDGNYFKTKLKRQMLYEYDCDILLVDGARSVADANAIKEVRYESHLIYMHAPFCVRFKRLKNRDRKGEEDIDKNYLKQRDEQELSWGVNKILSEYKTQSSRGYSKEYDVKYFYSNHDNVSALESELNLFVDNLI